MENKDPANRNKPTIQVERRRRPGPGSPDDQPRASAPQRREGQRQSSGSGGTQSSSGSGGGVPLELLLPLIKRLPWWVILLIVVCFVGFVIFSPNQGNNLDSTTYVEPTQPLEVFVPPPTDTSQPLATATRQLQAEATQAAAPAAGLPQVTKSPSAPDGKTWLVMLYQDADDKILEQDIYIDLNEAERVGSSQDVQIVAQIDRFRGGFQGDGNWTSTRRYFVTQDDDLERVNSTLVEDLGELNMSDPATLVDFVTWAVKEYPADRYMLILSDHGMGWPGGWSDASSTGGPDNNIPMTSVVGNQLYLMDLEKALGAIRTQTGIDKFDLIGMDACLMAQLEVFTALAPYARYAVTSEETEPSLGWAYTGFLSALEANPGMSGKELGRLIVESYIQDDQRIVDDRARAEFLQQGSPMGSLFGTISASQVAQQLERDVTLTAVDLAEIPQLLVRLNNLAFTMQSIDQAQVAQARTYAQSFTSVFGQDVPPSYIDLGSFVQLLAQNSRSAPLTQAANDVLAAIRQAVAAEKHGSKKPGATGISIYFPSTKLFRSPIAGSQSYNQIANQFAQQSLWDEFLAYHFSGRSFDQQEVGVSTVKPGNATRSPGGGQIDISAIRLSAATAAPKKPVTISADILGPNIGYIKLFVGFYDAASNSIFVADTDYLESQDTRQVDGVYYPVWPGEEFTLEYTWDTLVFAINDGVNTVTALFKPETYGASFEETVYTVDGQYTYADAGTTVYARLYFQNGVLRKVYGFTGKDGTGAPREITPQPGDTFTVLETWMDLDQSGQVKQTVYQEGSVLTFGDQMFSLESQYAAPGEYIVGLMVEDLQGVAYPSFAKVTVR